MVEVDEEGYSIRPEDAAAIRGFPDENTAQDSDNSDSEDGGCGQWVWSVGVASVHVVGELYLYAIHP